MNRPNIIKVIIAILLLIVVVVATVNYGRNQRMKINNTDTAKNSLPTVQEAKPVQNDKPNPSKPAQSQPKPETKPESKPEPAPAVTKPSTPNVSAPAVSAQIPQSSMPATGPADSIIPTIILGSLSGAYLVSRRKLKSIK